MMAKYPCVLQDDASTCGVACLATVARRFGRHPSWHHLREAAGTLNDGSNLAGLSAAAQAMGFISHAVKAIPEALPSLPTPFVAHLIHEGAGHFVVVHKVVNNHLVIANPASGLQKPSREEFLKEWTGKALLLAPKEGLPSVLESPNLLRRLLALILPHRRLLVESFAAAALMSGLSYGTALLFSNLVDHVFPSGEVWTLHLFGLLAVALAVFSGLFTVINTILVMTIGQRVSVQLMFPTLHRLIRLPMAYYESRRVGDILNRFSRVLGLKTLLTQGPVTLALDSLVLIFTGLALFLFHWQMALAAATVLPVMLVSTLLARLPVRRLHREILAQSGKLDAQLVSMLGGLATIKAYGAEEMMSERTEPPLGRIIRTSSRLEVLSMIPRVINRVLAASVIVAIYWLGGAQVMAGELTLGQLIFCITLTGSLFPPFLSLLDMVLQVQQAMATLDRATDIVDAEPEAGPKQGVTKEIRGEIRVEGLSFHYGYEEDVLRDVSFRAPPGEVVAIVGESGSGKSSLIKLVQRMYNPHAGRILVDGTDIRDWDLTALRASMALVDQDCRTFAGSIEDNLKLAGPDIPADRFLSALQIVGLGPFVERLPARLGTEVGEAGTRLSGGERQRLSLARALARHPRILLLDEATAHLDPGMEREVFTRIRTALRSSTILVATHRIALARTANRVVVLDRGRVAEYGTPAELYEAKGLFHRFCGAADDPRKA